jgi:hydrogenase nickel incorporation protein HypA/HybF
MHELSIAAEVLDQAKATLASHPGARCTKIALRIGELAGVDCDSLRFGFEVMVKDTPWEPLALEIESVARRQRCRLCHHEFEAANFATQCPQCGDPCTENIAGDELQIAYLEIDE